MVPSAVINEAIVFITILALGALVRQVPKEKLGEAFQYFTVLSNLFCAFSALLLLIGEVFGSMPTFLVVLKYMSTSAVTLTFLTVFLFLLPASRSVQGLLDSWPQLTMHLFTPVLAILSFLCFEKGDMSPWVILLGLLPVALYAAVYLNRVVFARAWRDLYGFNKNGRWKVSMSFMALGAAAVAVLLWAL